MNTPTSTESTPAVHHAIAALACGRPIVVDAAGNGGHLVFAASLARGEQVGWMVRHTSGFVLAATTADRLDALDIPPVINRHGHTEGGFAVSVDASADITTGISGHDRATTLRTLAAPDATAHDLVRPGHVVPVSTDSGGVLARSEAPETAVDLLRLAGLAPVAAVCALVGEDGDLLAATELARFAADHAVARVRVTDVVAYRLSREPITIRDACPPVSTTHGTFAVHQYHDNRSGDTYLAFQQARPAATRQPVAADSLAGWNDSLDQSLAGAAVHGGTVLAIRHNDAAQLGRVAAEVLRDLGTDDLRIHCCLELPTLPRSQDTRSQLARPDTAHKQHAAHEHPR